MNNPRGRWMAAGLLAALCIGCLGALFGGTREAGYRFLWAAALAALTVLGGRCLNLPDRRERRCFMALGALMAGAQALGLRLELSGYTGVTGLLLCVGAGVGAGLRRAAHWPRRGGGCARCRWARRNGDGARARSHGAALH